MPPLPENVLLRMACEAAEGLVQWHQVAGSCHADVAARSFLVTGDMSVVIGDYGMHSVTYRQEFVSVGDHQLVALRWSPPEILTSTDEIIPITTSKGNFINSDKKNESFHRIVSPIVLFCFSNGFIYFGYFHGPPAANVWSFGVVLWEILTFGCRPYDILADDQVVQQVLREKRTVLNPPDLNYQQGQPLYQLMLQCWEVDATLRPSMPQISSRLAAILASVSRDVECDVEKAIFDSRWDAAKPAPALQSQISPSASLNNLHGSLDDLSAAHRRGDSSLETGAEKEDTSTFSAKVSAVLRSLDEALAAAGSEEDDTCSSSSSSLPEPQFLVDGTRHDDQYRDKETRRDGSNSSDCSLFSSSSSSWQDKVNCGQLTALVRDKSRSVQDLMILTHVEPMSDIEMLGHPRHPADEHETRAPDHEVVNSSRTTAAAAAARQILPQISVTSPSSTVRSAHAESDIPLLDSTDAKLVLNAIPSTQWWQQIADPSCRQKLSRKYRLIAVVILVFRLMELD